MLALFEDLLMRRGHRRLPGPDGFAMTHKCALARFARPGANPGTRSARLFTELDAPR
jgi:hypothetical protein